jgi:hypothetical protein
MWLKALRSNKLPQVVCSLLVKCMEDSGVGFCRLRSDKGTENIHAASIMMAIGGRKAHIFGTSTRNTRIESFWGRLRMNLGMQKWITFFETITSKEGGDDKIYDEKDPYHTLIAHFVFGDLINFDLNCAMNTWNVHRIRSNKKIDFKGGAPNTMYRYPEKYGWKDWGVAVPQNLRAVAEEKGFLIDIDDPFGINDIKPLLKSALSRAGFEDITFDNKGLCFRVLVNDIDLKLEVLHFALKREADAVLALHSADSVAEEYYVNWGIEDNIANFMEVQQLLNITPQEVEPEQIAEIDEALNLLFQEVAADEE